MTRGEDNPKGADTHPRSWPWGLIAGVLSGALVLGAGIGAVSGLVADATATLLGTPLVQRDEPLQPGEPGSADAVIPLQCPGSCFSEKTVGEFGTDDSHFDEIGLISTTAPWGFYEETPASVLYGDDLEYWDEVGGEPGECFFSFTRGPYAPRVGHPDAGAPELIYFVVTHEDRREMDSGRITARIFPDTAAASTYLHDVASAVTECSQSAMTSYRGDPGQVSELAALDVPDSVAAVAWVLELPPGWGWRTYFVDLQRGNAIVRFQVITDGAISEQQFRTLVETYARDDFATVEVGR